MIVSYPNLTKSAKGFYGYRRRIPEHLRYLFGGVRELKRSFRTKGFELAVRQWREMNRHWDERVAAHEALCREVGADDGQLPMELVARAEKALKGFGIHPAQQPVLKAGASETDRRQFEAEDEAWRSNTEVLSDNLADRYLDEDQRQKDYEEREWGRAGYRDPYEPKNPRDPLVIAAKILAGDIDVVPDPTFQNVLDHYLKKRRLRFGQIREEGTLAKREKEACRSFKKIAGYLPDGMGTSVNRLDPETIETAVRELWPNAATRKRNIVPMKAGFNRWNADHKSATIENPFEGLVTEEEVRFFERERRSFTPEEHASLLENLDKDEDEELRLIGRLMSDTGAPNEEVAQLSVEDVKISADPPHILFRNTAIRRMDKGRLERAVPLVDPVLPLLERYLSRLATNSDLLFPNWGKKGKSEHLSRALNGLVVNTRPTDEKLLSIYSLRHTFKDRATAAAVRQDIIEYLMGHKSAGSSEVNRRYYGTGTPPSTHVDDMRRIVEVKEWGYFD